LEHKVLVSTGFHRSATSATANYLANAGVDMGDDLVAPHISNVKGHYEDWQAVQLHDKQLEQSGTTWQFHDEVLLKPTPDFLDTYIQMRSSKSTLWGIKDPRACLFLNEWELALNGGCQYVFVVRHWSGCIESLLNRHSRELAYGLLTVDTNNPHIQLWSKPDIAARAWLAYNKRMLHFAKQHPKKVVLCTQRALFEGAPLIQTINERFDFSLDVQAQSPFDSNLFNDSACMSIKNNLSHSLIMQLDSVWNELIGVADFSSTESEEPIYYNNHADDSKCYENYQLATSTLPIEHRIQLNTDIEKVNTFELLDSVDEIKWIEYLSSLRMKVIDEATLSHIELFVNQHFPLSDKLHLELARVLQFNAHYSSAIHTYYKSIALGIKYPFVYMLMAQCYQHLEQYELALHFFDKAKQANPNNAVFYVEKANCLSKQNLFSLAEKEFLLGIDYLGYQVPLALHFSEFLVKNDKVSEALNILNQSDVEHAAIQRKLTQVSLLVNYQLGVDSYYEFMTKQLEGKDKIRWLSGINQHINSGCAERDFVIRCYKHWDKLPTNTNSGF
jgi:tetratricopeptide (TPR) repeat protein